MTRPRWLLAAGLALVAVAAAGAIVLVVRDSGRDSSTLRPVRAHASVSDRIVAFGDTIRARVDVGLDLRHVDPSSVKVRAAFDGWRRIGPAQVTRSDAGSSSHLQVTYVLRCTRQACVPEREILPFAFEPARVEFVNRAGGRGLIQVLHHDARHAAEALGEIDLRPPLADLVGVEAIDRCRNLEARPRRARRRDDYRVVLGKRRVRRRSNHERGKPSSLDLLHSSVGLVKSSIRRRSRFVGRPFSAAAGSAPQRRKFWRRARSARLASVSS